LEDATDGYDEGIDFYAPPAPPSGFDAALAWNFERYYTQVLSLDGDYSEHVWDIQLQYPTDNLIELSWDNTGWSDKGTFILQDAFGGLLGIDIDMTQETEVLPSTSKRYMQDWSALNWSPGSCQYQCLTNHQMHPAK
jgi:hypothetical protein